VLQNIYLQKRGKGKKEFADECPGNSPLELGLLLMYIFYGAEYEF
jgi:hypothetical protein